MELLTRLGAQFRQAARRLARTPLFTTVVLLTLGTSIGANTAVFSVLESVLLRPLPYPRSDELVSISHSAPGMNIQDLVTTGPANYFIYREQNTTLAEVGLYQTDAVNVSGNAEPERIRALRATDGILPLLGVVPLLGRNFNRQDAVPGSADTAMLSYSYWRRAFGGDPSIVGRKIQVDGVPTEVIGVLPQGFQYLGEESPAVVVPLRFDRAKIHLANFAFHMIARRKPGASLDQVKADVARMLPIVLRSFPMPQGYSIAVFEQAGFRPLVRPLKQTVVGGIGSTLWVLMGSIGMVMLIACANVANLMLVRMEGRRQEIAIRFALGARRKHIAGELLLESGLLALLGSALGIVAALVLLRGLLVMAPKGLPRIHDVGMDGPVLLFNLGLSTVAALLVGLIPVLKHAGGSAGVFLRAGGRGQSAGRAQQGARSALVVVQVALALVLLICSGLMARTFVALTRVQPGFADPAGLQTFTLYIPATEAQDADAVARMCRQILRRVSEIPGVASAGASATIPMDGREEGLDDEPMYAEDHTYPAGALPPLRRYKTISPGLLSTMGTPLVAGRDLTWEELYNKSPHVLMSEKLARELWRNPAAAVGKRIREGDAYQWQEVVGVVADVHDDGLNMQAPSSVYWPLVRNDFGSQGRVQRLLAVAVRSPRAGTESLMKDLRRAVWSVDASLPLANVRTGDSIVNQSLGRTSFTLILLAVSSGMALLLGSVGVYGVIAYSVSQRTREMGIRLALGAQQRALTGMFLRHTLGLAVAGAACGFAVAVALSGLLPSVLYEVSPLDPATYAAAAAGLLAAALLAGYLPSRRVARIDPVEALKAE